MEKVEFRRVYFNSAAKTIITHKFSLENAFHEMLCRIDNWINEGSGWIVELILSQYINILTYRPLSGSSYINVPAELKSSKMRLINIKKKNVFFGVMLAILIPQKNIQKELHEKFKNLSDLNYYGIEFHT